MYSEHFTKYYIITLDPVLCDKLSDETALQVQTAETVLSTVVNPYEGPAMTDLIRLQKRQM